MRTGVSARWSNRAHGARYACYYAKPNLFNSRARMTTKTKALITLGILAVFDTVIPVPITALIVIYAILQKPPWVTDLVRDIYGMR